MGTLESFAQLPSLKIKAFEFKGNSIKDSWDDLFRYCNQFFEISLIKSFARHVDGGGTHAPLKLHLADGTPRIHDAPKRLLCLLSRKGAEDIT